MLVSSTNLCKARTLDFESQDVDMCCKDLRTNKEKLGIRYGESTSVKTQICFGF